MKRYLIETGAQCHGLPGGLLDSNPCPRLASNTTPPIAAAYLSHAQSMWRVFAVVKIKDVYKGRDDASRETTSLPRPHPT
jgi:hypothetical protein